MESKLNKSDPIVPSEDMPSKTPLLKARDPIHKQRILAWQVANNIFSSFRYAGNGIVYTFETQRNFKIHCLVGIIALSLGIVLRLSGVEMAVICITSGLVLTLELLNTAIESVVDLTVGKEYHLLAKIAKDCAAGSVLISAISAVFVAGWLMLPKILLLINVKL